MLGEEKNLSICRTNCAMTNDQPERITLILKLDSCPDKRNYYWNVSPFEMRIDEIWGEKDIWNKQCPPVCHTDYLLT